MLALGLFYFLLLLLVVLIIYMILLFDNYKSRTLAPPLMNAFYGVESVGPSVHSYYRLKLTNGLSVTKSIAAAGDFSVGKGTCGGIMFASAGPSSIPIEFIPQQEDMYRPFNGMFRILAASSREHGQNIRLRIRDSSNNSNIVDNANYYIPTHGEGLTEINIPFTAEDLRDTPSATSTAGHRIQFYGLSPNGIHTTSIPTNSLLINSMNVTYY